MNSNKQFLILVDENDTPVGKMEKMEAHRLGILHRAFSVFIFNSKGELLLQQRADGKYHSGGLWTNTCCSHPIYGEELKEAVNRRLNEEMGLDVEVKFVFSFVYEASFDNGLKEHEFDHVYFGVSNDQPKPDPEEVKDWRYMSLKKLENELKVNMQQYSAWLNICFEKVNDKMELLFEGRP